MAGQKVSIRAFVFTVLALTAIQIVVLLTRGGTGEPSGDDRTAVVARENTRTEPEARRRIANNRLNLLIPVDRAGVVAVVRNNRFIISQTVAGGGALQTGALLDHGPNHFSIWFLDDHGISTCLDSFTVVFRHPDYEYLVRPLNRVTTADKLVAFTFDAGSGANGADSLIRIITGRGLHLTFFLTGDFIRKYPALVHMLAAGGQEIGNHTSSHPNLTTWAQNGRHRLLDHVDQAFVRKQLDAADSLFHNLTGMRMQPYWRAPFGEYNAEILQWAALAGYKHIGWTPGCDTWDWVADTTSPLYLSGEALLEKLIRLEDSGKLTGAIVLMHLNSEREHDPLYKSLPKILDTLMARGYRILSVSELQRAAAGS